MAPSSEQQYSHMRRIWLLGTLGSLNDFWNISRKPQVGDDGPRRAAGSVDNVHVLQKPFGNGFTALVCSPSHYRHFYLRAAYQLQC